MSFKADAFNRAQFKPRTVKVALPDLADWFEGEPAWTVRGLSGPEMAQCTDAAARNRSRAAMAEGLLSEDQTAQIEAMRELLGVGAAVPDDIAKRLEMLVLGSVEPVIDHSTAVKLCTHFPVEFYNLTTKIMELTGMGSEVGKPRASTATRKSEPA